MEKLEADDALEAGRIPACVFVRPGESPRTVFGCRPDGSLVHISSARPGERNILCPECGTRLVAKLKGMHRVLHFSHYKKGECATAGETALHRIAKEIILRAASLCLPAYTVETGAGSPECIQPACQVGFDNVEVESWQEGFRPDLIGTRTGKDGEPVGRLIIEIRVTHAVDDRKLGKLRARGDSVLEIDLSGISRNLEGPELAAQIIKDAPRRWLYHRREEAFLREAERRQARREKIRAEKKAFAISMAQKEEKDRQADRSRPPRLSPPEMDWAMAERRNWSLVGMRGLYSRAADDGVFDVPPDLWRAYVLSILTPWRKRRYNLGFRPDTAKICAHLSAGLRSKGWVKPAFGAPHKVFANNRKREVDPVCDAVWDFFRDGLLDYGFSDPGDYRQPGLEKAQEAVSKAWADYLGWRHAVLILSRELKERGVLLRLGSGCPGSDEDIDRLCLERPDVTRNRFYIADFISELRSSKPAVVPLLRPDVVNSQGLAFELPESRAPDTTAEAIRYLRHG